MKRSAVEWLLAAAVACTLIVGSRGIDCVARGPCSCEIAGQGVIDLSGLGKKDGPAWPNLTPSEPKDPSKYAVNVCYGFDQDACKGATCCQMRGSLSYTCGTPDTVAYSVDTGTNNVIMTYTGDGGRAAIIILVCDNSTSGTRMDAQGESPNLPSFYRFTLTSICACPGGCKATTYQPTTVTVPPIICVPKDACSCEVEGRGIIDLHSIAKDGAWMDLPSSTPSDPSTYSLSVCSGFNDGPCQNASCCQTRNGSKYMCGRANAFSFGNNQSTGNVIITYLGDNSRITIVELICNKYLYGVLVDAIGEKTETINIYYFTLTTRCACPGLCSSAGHDNPAAYSTRTIPPDGL